MADSNLPVDGVTPPAPDLPEPETAPPAPAPQKKPAAPKAVKRWKGMIVAVIGMVTVAYLGWGLLLISLLPSKTGDLRELESAGVLSAAAAGVFYIAVAIIAGMRIKEAAATPVSKQIAFVKLFLAVVPGLVMSAAMPYLITREPSLTITIVSPTTQEEIVAPLVMTFSVEDAATVMNKRTGFKPIRYRWDLNGDKKFDQETVTPELTATFDTAGIITLAAVMMDASGQTKVASRRFVIPQAVFSVAPNPPLVEKPVVFSLVHLLDEANPITEVQWDFNEDGKADEVTTELEFSQTFYRVGKTKVSATVTMQNKTQTRLERIIDVQNPAPLPFPVTVVSEPKYLISPAPFPTLFRVETEEPVAQVQWNFGDGEKAEGVRVAHTFERKGSFPVVAKVWSQSGTVAEITTVVQVVDRLSLPDLAFDGSPQLANGRIRQEVPVTINLTPRTLTPFVKFFWEVQDATEVGSTDTQLQAIYRREGNYTVTLIAQDSEDRVLRMPIAVEVLPAASYLSFQMNPENGVAPLDVQFDASETFIPNETITGFEWDFGDNTPVVFGGARAKHRFVEPGDYTVSLIARTVTGKEFDTTRTIVVRAPPMSACIEPSRISGSSPLGVEFSMDCSSGVFTKVTWDFGDDSSSAERSPVHVFTQPGTYNVILTLEDANLRQAKNTVTITVR